MEKTITLSGLSCRTSSSQEDEMWEVMITSLEPKIEATGYGDSEEEAFQDAQDAFQIEKEDFDKEA